MRARLPRSVLGLRVRLLGSFAVLPVLGVVLGTGLGHGVVSLGLVALLALGAAWVGSDLIFLRRGHDLVVVTDRVATGAARRGSRGIRDSGGPAQGGSAGDI